MKIKLIALMLVLTTMVFANKEVDTLELKLDKVEANLEELVEVEDIKWSKVRTTLREKVGIEAQIEYFYLISQLGNESITLASEKEENKHVEIEKIESRIEDEMKKESVNVSVIKNLVDKKADIKYEVEYDLLVEEHPFDWSSVKLFQIF